MLGAIAAVDEAMKKLPEEDGVKFTVFEAPEGGGGWGGPMGDREPLNPGSKVQLAHVC